MEITKLNQINTDTQEGRMLMAALAKLTTESQRDKEPDEVLAQVNALKNKMYPASIAKGVSKKKGRVFKFSEYKKAQALWLQRENAKRTNAGQNTESFCLMQYADYLGLIGFSREGGNEKIEACLKSLDTPDHEKSSLDEAIERNINELMDDLI
jgi:hypothetical protein